MICSNRSLLLHVQADPEGGTWWAVQVITAVLTPNQGLRLAILYLRDGDREVISPADFRESVLAGEVAWHLEADALAPPQLPRGHPPPESFLTSAASVPAATPVVTPGAPRAPITGGCLCPAPGWMHCLT